MAETQLRFPHALPRQLGYGALLILLLLAAVFYQERTLFIDIAFQTFLMITEGTLQVQVYRFGSALVQLLPLLAIQLRLPLDAVLMAYSLSFPLLYLLCYWLIVRVLRNDYLGLVLVLLFTLFYLDGFYWATSELQQALAFLLVVWAFVWRYPALDQWWHWLLLPAALLTLAFYHPLTFIPFFFLWAFSGLREAAFRHWRYLLLAAVMVLALLAKSKWGANWYDAAKMKSFQANFEAYWPHLHTMPSHRKFLLYCVHHWPGIPLALLAVTGVYLWQRQWLRLLLVWGTCAAFLLLSHIGSPDLTYRFYAEVNYMPLAIFLGVPLVFDVLPRLRRRTLFVLLIAFLCLRLGSIALHHAPYTARLAWLSERLDGLSAEHPGANRFVATDSPALTDTLLMTWGSPYETLLLSARPHPDSARTLAILPQPARYDTLWAQDQWFIGAFKAQPIHTVDGFYFRLGQGQYVPVSE